MGLEYLIKRFEHTAGSIERLARGVAEEQARWKPTPEEWSLLEVVCHLHDEERRDFRPRIQSTLKDPETPWEGFDPEGLVTENRYNEQDLDEVIDNFLDERGDSLAWLRAQSDLDWNATYQHPRLGPLTVGGIMGSWLAHDCLHLRQLAHLHYQWLAREFAPHTLDYAGPWGEKP